MGGGRGGGRLENVGMLGKGVRNKGYWKEKKKKAELFPPSLST